MEEKKNPYYPLMQEHRLIERVVKVIKDNVTLMKFTNNINPSLVGLIVDFLRLYADRCHHGKEEEILFRALEGKNMSDDHKMMMKHLLEDHILARRLTSTMADANERYMKGDNEAFSIIRECMENLAKFYPEHIRKEDNDFFRQVMQYFNEFEIENMIRAEYDFDRHFLHMKYELQVAQIEKLLK